MTFSAQTRLMCLSAATLLLAACGSKSDGRSFERAQEAMARGDHAAARVELLNAARERPGDAAVRLAMAETLLELGDALGGDAAADEASGLGAPAGRVAVLRADAAIMRGDVAAAQSMLAAIAADAVADRARVAGGIAMLRDDAPGAIALFREGLAAADDARLRIDLGHALLASGDIAGAAEQARLATGLAPQRVGGPLLTAIIADRNEDAAASLAAYDAVLAIQSTNVAALLGRADAQAKLGRFDDVEDAIGRVAEVAPAHPRLAYLKARLAAHGGDLNEARRILGGAGSQLDDDLDALVLGADVALQTGYPSLAVSKARRAHAIASGEPYLNYLLANALWHDGQAEEAKTVMRFFDHADVVPAPARTLAAALAAGAAPPAQR